MPAPLPEAALLPTMPGPRPHRPSWGRMRPMAAEGTAEDNTTTDSLTSNGTTGDSRSRDVAAVLAAEERRYRAMVDADLATLDELCADELSYAHSSGARDTKGEYL